MGPVEDNAFLQAVYQERLKSAEIAADRVQGLHRGILDKMAHMAKDGVLYSRSQRQADSDALKEAEEQFRLILASVYEVEDDLRG